MPDKRDMNISRLNLNGFPSFITTKTMDNYPFFSNTPNGECLVSCLIFGHRNNWFDLVAFVIMPDHLHVIIIPRGKNVSQTMHSIKSFSSKEINKRCHHKGSLWQPSFRDLTLWSEDVVIEKINYIHNNPVRKGLVSDPGNYHFSSANTRYEKELFRAF